MDYSVHVWVDIILALITFFGGWMLRILHADLKAIKMAHADLGLEHKALKEKLPDVYVRRDAFDYAMGDLKDTIRRTEEKVERGLERIFDRLDSKQDKP